MRLEIDWTRCAGHGLCAALLPQAIGRDDWGYPILDRARLDRLPAADLKRVVSCCPALALRLEKSRLEKPRPEKLRPEKPRSEKAPQPR